MADESTDDRLTAEAADDRGPAEDGRDETVESLRSEAARQGREAAEARDRHLRTLAEFDNYRKRIAREREDWRRQAQDEVVRELLAVLDNFDRALSAEPGEGSDASFRTGVELIQRDFLKALERVGVRPFASVGEPFDPLRHEAVARVERSDVPDQTVVSEIVRGYLSRDRVLRPARVVVAVERPAP
jgi:molecular chaperone GrpE